MKKKYICVLCATAVLNVTGGALPSIAKEPKAKVPTYEESAQNLEIITLSNAIDKSLQASPRLQSAKAGLGAAKGAEQQAGYWANPEISVEAENIAGQKQYEGFESAEVTYGVSQQIEIGGKRSARKNIANKGYTLAELELESTRLNLIRNVMVAYADSVAAQEQVKLAREQKKLAAEVLESVKQRVDAAADPLYQKSKADVAYSTSLIALDKAEREYNVAKSKLSALWGEENTFFNLNSTDFFEISAPDELESINESLKNNPDYLRGDAEFDRSKAELNLEKANAIPDPKINVGVRDFRDGGDQAFVVGVSLPIPVLNRNQGNIAKVQHEMARTSANRQAERIDLATSLNSNWQELQNAYKQAKSLKSSIIPSAEKAFTLARQGYRAGKFPYLEVLDAQRTLSETREQYITTLKQYHSNRAEVERLTAKYMANNTKQGANHEEEK